MPDAGHLQQCSNARGILVCAGERATVGELPDVVVVRANHEQFIRQSGITAADHAQHVRRRGRRERFARKSHAHACLQGKRRRRGDQILGIHPQLVEQCPQCTLRDLKDRDRVRRLALCLRLFRVDRFFRFSVGSEDQLAGTGGPVVTCSA